MALTLGVRLGVYEVTASLGAGGMGEVYRARDTKLNRDVALKILPQIFAADPERLARFQREAQVLASLNHPHIGAIYGFEEAGGVQALVLELVEGPTLADLIAGTATEAPAARASGGGAPRALEIDDALRIACQIADALAAAHEHGIIHRDLKPANIKRRPDGVVKVLDFGLAKALADEISDLNMANSPTFTAASKAGVILGTAAYMSPEQARGRPVDKRTDIWAFGCVVYELLTGSQAFAGETISDSLVSVLTREPDLTKVPADTPEAVLTLLRRCFQKDPQKRLRDAADIKLAIEEASTPSVARATPAQAAPSRRSLPRRAALVAGAVIIAAALFAAGGRWSQTTDDFPANWRGELLGGSTVAMAPRISPDGTTLAFTAMVDGQDQIAVMKPQSGNWTILTHDRTRGLTNIAAWSRDGTTVYFDRLLDVPVGIFSVPVLGGDERLVLEDAMGPEVIPDGSLLVTKINADRAWQLYHFFPDAQRLVPLPALESANLVNSAARAFPNGHEAVFFGRPAGAENTADHLYVIDLANNHIRRIAPSVSIPRRYVQPLAVTHDNAWVLFDLPSGNLHRIVAAADDGSDRMRQIATLTEAPSFLDTGADGSVYLDQFTRPSEVLQYSPKSKDLLRSPIPSTFNVEKGAVVALPDGRLVAPMRVIGRARLMAMAGGKDPVPFIAGDEESSPPAALVGRDTIAFIAGTPPHQTIALASVADGRITRRFQDIDATPIQSLAGSPDGQTIYYAASGTIWTVPAAGGTPRKIHAGDQVAPDPSGQDLVILLTEAGGVRLVRVSLADGHEVAVPVPANLRLIPDLAPNAVHSDGRIVVRLGPKDSWFYPAGILDPRAGTIEILPGGEDADMSSSGWGPDGRVVTAAMLFRSSLWRFSPVTSTSQ